MDRTKGQSREDGISTFDLCRPNDLAGNPGEFWRQSKGSARMLRYVSLLYSGFFLIQPFFEHSLRKWMYFGIAYVIFLALYFAIPHAEGRLQRLLIGAMFVLAFVYYPFNCSASGLFVYPIVMLAFIVRDIRNYLLMLAVEIVAICAETMLLHLPWWTALSGIFFCIIIGLSNFSYSRQQRAAFLLNRANDEIEHLAQVAERERIARDLHDLLGHTLTVIAIKSELANRLLLSDPTRAAQEMREVEDTARHALAEVREAVTGYRSEGLETEIQRARKALNAADVHLTTAIDPVNLTAAQANVLCLVLREAVTNIVRHSRASACTVTLARTGEYVRLSVEDNGIGFGHTEGNGLRGIRERIGRAGGDVRLSRATPSGTSLSIQLPTPYAEMPSSPQSHRTAPANWTETVYDSEATA